MRRNVKLTVAHNIVADLKVLALQLRRSVGAFDLVLLLEANATPGSSTRRWARIDSVDVFAQTPGGGGHLATLRPSTAARLEQFDNQVTHQFEFQAPLHRRQLLELEDLRDGKDLGLRLSITGIGGTAEDSVGRASVRDEHFHTVRRSEWIDQLNGAGALGVLLVEAPIPFVANVDDDGVARRLLAAEAAFHNGEYGRCVGDCRLAYDRLGLTATPRTKLPEMQSDMSFGERIELLIAAARHCTHLAHHDDADLKSEHVYTREEARLVLQITAAALSFQLRP